MAERFNTSPLDVDRMELWQVVACFIPVDLDEDVSAATVGPVSGMRMRGRPMRSVDVIKARLAAQAAGKPEPLHLFGDVDLAD